MKKRKSSRLLWHICFTIFLTLLSMTLSVMVFSYGFNESYNAIIENSTRKDHSSVSQLTLDISSTTTIEDVASLLYTNNFIGNKLFFITQSKLSSTSLHPGTYTLNSSMSNSTILDLLTTPKDDTVASIKLTIPEGYTLVEIANKVDDLGIMSKQAFLDAATNRTYNYTFLKDLPDDLPYALEGYLFPDTYFVSPNISAEQLIIKMLDRFQEISSKYSSHLYNSDYTLHDVLTIASIIEEETRLEEERSKVSGVIYNRLDSHLKLQMCSTVQYVLSNRKASLSLDDLATPSPYNTYIHNGLPVGPICSPGEASLKAAFLPDEHDFFFFVLNNPKEGSHSFSRTAEEHALYKAQYNQLKDQNFTD